MKQGVTPGQQLKAHVKQLPERAIVESKQEKGPIIRHSVLKLQDVRLPALKLKEHPNVKLAKPLHRKAGQQGILYLKMLHVIKAEDTQGRSKHQQVKDKKYQVLIITCQGLIHHQAINSQGLHRSTLAHKAAGLQQQELISSKAQDRKLLRKEPKEALLKLRVWGHHRSKEVHLVQGRKQGNRHQAARQADRSAQAEAVAAEVQEFHHQEARAQAAAPEHQAPQAAAPVQAAEVVEVATETDKIVLKGI